MTDETQTNKQFDIAVQIRNFEIELFWKRSFFFWGFISSAFVGYAALRNNNPGLGLIVACFGMVCSFAWTLLNRGSKYWQESWETKVERVELVVTGKFFAQEELAQDKGWWLSARKFSVSKLAIALSDYVFILWFLVVVVELIRRYVQSYASPLNEYALGLFAAFSVLYLPALLMFGRKSL